ncbi:hypothetical protein AAF712_011491 [Marasmius tenuissimus]|uniref:Serine-threonine/tyrosine-protein kinase catalytic domain-containing protein n=1 Tax=Marasmius tenuissimus TaxID=585030 RepID=A0ABR2ZKH6_9AGAR
MRLEKRPMRPVGIPELNDRMWNIMEACWNTNSAIRPKATEVLHRIKSEILVERRATRFVDRIGSKHLPQHQTSHRSPASAAHDSTQVREKDWVEPELEADTEGRGLHEPIYSLFPLVGNKIKRSFVRPWITPLEDAEFTHSDSTPQHEHPMDHGIITEGQDRAVEQGGHHSNTAKGVLIKTISSGEGLDLLLHELPVNDKHPSVDDREGSWRPQIRSKSRERTTSAGMFSVHSSAFFPSLTDDTRGFSIILASEQVKIKKERGWLSKWTNGCRDNKEVNTNGEQEELTVLIGALYAYCSLTFR